MESAQEIAISISSTIERIKSEYRRSKFINDLDKLDADTKRRTKIEGRALADWNATVYNKKRRHFNHIVRKVCKRNGRSENHIRRIAGWKRGRNITNVQLNDKD